VRVGVARELLGPRTSWYGKGLSCSTRTMATSYARRISLVRVRVGVRLGEPYPYPYAYAYP
jgi:hypothetical protein